MQMLATKEQGKLLLHPGAEGTWADGGRLLKLPPPNLGNTQTQLHLQTWEANRLCNLGEINMIPF